jgi:hypothetical protein
LHADVRIARLALLCLVVLAIGVVLVSGGEDGGPRTPPALPGLPPPFLGTAVAGDGELTAAVDAYGDVVDLRAGPAGEALIDNPAYRQAAGTVPEDTGIVPRVAIAGGAEEGRDGSAADPVAMWQADRVTQRYLAGTNVVRTVAWFGGRGDSQGSGATQVVMTVAAAGRRLALRMQVRGKDADLATPSVGIDVADGAHCTQRSRAALLDLVCGSGRGVPPVSGPAAGDVVDEAVAAGRRWLRGSIGLGAGAPGWARRMYVRSLLTMHALTSERTGAAAAGARDGWAYVWPRDAATAALALEASGHHAEARAVAKFLTGLDLNAAARFDEAGEPVPGRAAQGDALGWVNAAARATGIPAPRGPHAWRDRADYQESTPGTYLANALANLGVDGPKTQASLEFSAHQRRVLGEFGTAEGLVRVAGDPGSGLDSAAGWAVRPFALRSLYPAAERTLLQLTAAGTTYGITPGEGWQGGEDPWTAPTAWSAWALAGLATDAREPWVRDPRTNLPAVREGGGPSPRASTAGPPAARPPAARAPATPARAARARAAALQLLADLRRASTPAGDLPERVGVHTGIPTSTTPLLWSSAFAVLALRELWP